MKMRLYLLTGILIVLAVVLLATLTNVWVAGGSVVSMVGVGFFVNTWRLEEESRMYCWRTHDHTDMYASSMVMVALGIIVAFASWTGVPFM